MRLIVLIHQHRTDSSLCYAAFGIYQSDFESPRRGEATDAQHSTRDVEPESQARSMVASTKASNMITKLNNRMTMIGAAALVALLMTAAATAQEKGSARGGAGQLLPPVLVYPAKPVAAEGMKCAACRDVLVGAPNRELRGAGARELVGNTETKVAKHLCTTCGTRFEVRGHGKAAREVAVHICGDCLASGKPAPKAVGAPKPEVGKITAANCCKDAWVVSGYEAKPRGYDPVPKYSLKHLCPECAKTAAR